jgi:hypothetical protein
MKYSLLLFLAFVSTFSNGQKTDQFTISLSGGLKRTIFKNSRTQISVSNASPSFSYDLIIPEIRNTIAFFVIARGNKPIADKWSITNSAGLDMQQLNIVSGFRKNFDNTSVVTGYSQTYYNELLPRIKLDFGLNYQLFRIKTSAVSLGASAGEMIALSSSANTYSFGESNLKFTSKRIALFISGSIMPYNIQLKNFESLTGNLGAEFIYASYLFRIKEIAAGLSCQL